MSSISGSGRSPGAGNGYLLQYTCLDNPMDRGAWQATVHVITNSQTHLSTCTHTHTHRVSRSSEVLLLSSASSYIDADNIHISWFLVGFSPLACTSGVERNIFPHSFVIILFYCFLFTLKFRNSESKCVSIPIIIFQ